MWTPTLLLTVLSLLSAVIGQDASDCDSTCQATFEATLAEEQSTWATTDILSDSFYSTPSNFTGSKPGDVLRWQEISSDMLATNWSSIPTGMSLTRMMYVSEDIDRNPIPATAFILLPYSPASFTEPNATVFRTIAWAHGTAGRSRQCAPSNNRELWYGWEAPFFYAANGYAVIATDYAGQGSDVPGGFHYEAGYIHAADVAYSVVAARQMMGHLLSEDWVVAGHSEGGMTAWRTNERLAMPGQEELLKAGNFLGALSAAPALRPYDLIPKSIELAGDGPLGDVVSVYLLQSLSLIYDDLDINDYVTNYTKALLPLIDEGCLITGEIMFQNLTTAEIYKNTSWLTSPQFADWQTRFNGAGPHELAAPMLVVQGLNDTLTYAENTQDDFNRTCSTYTNSTAQLFLVPGLGHDPAFQAAQGYYIAWISERFAGAELETGCSILTAAPTNDRYQEGQLG
ncbi:hypothetical protein G7054_g3441 [Neopestalotiopsis clavispora]|nr:hypothetical protein G7054_g3441 [Neopestalotiopsis clavispora]